MKRKRIRPLGCILVSSLMAASLVGFSVKASHDELQKYSSLMLPAVQGRIAPNTVRVTFCGVSCLLFDDGKNALLVDGFFTRPKRTEVILGRIAPDLPTIDACLTRAEVGKLDAVVVSHSHYDHALDCAEISKRTGAVVVGSESTANIARGGGVAPDHIRVMKDGSSIDFGAFHVTYIRSEHAPSAAMAIAGGDIDKPLKPPTHALHYQEGGTYSILIKHDKQTVLVQSSAGFSKGALKGVSAPTIFLGVGLLGKQSDKYREQFWQEVVRTVGAKRVIPVHWDDFMRPLSQPLSFAPKPFDEVEKAIDFVIAKGKQDGIEVRFAPVFKPIALDNSN